VTAAVLVAWVMLADLGFSVLLGGLAAAAVVPRRNRRRHAASPMLRIRRYHARARHISRGRHAPRPAVAVA
jgi:hypothetical protein